MSEFNREDEDPDFSDEVEAQIRAIRKTLSEQWSEILSAVLLSAVTIGTAWSGFQSAQWGGIQSTLYSRASALRVESTRDSTLAGQLATIDIIVFTGWVNAYAQGDEPLAAFYEERFRDEFKPAFDAWLATDPTNNPDAPPTPFRMAEYRIESLEESDRLEEEASELFTEGQRANKTSDDYAFSTVLLATVLFFAGIATRFEWQPIRWALLGVGIILLIFGVINLLSLPIA